MYLLNFIILYCTLYIVHCTLYIVHCCAQYTLSSPLSSAHCNVIDWWLVHFVVMERFATLQTFPLLSARINDPETTKGQKRLYFHPALIGSQKQQLAQVFL